VMVYSASAVFASTRLNDSAHFLWRQVVFATIGAAALYLGWRVDYQWYRRAMWPLVAFIGALLVAVLIPGVGRAGGGAMRWIPLGMFALQPGEFAKPIVVIALAAALARRSERQAAGQPAPALWAPLVIPGVLMVLLLLEPDFGSAVILGLLTFVLLFVGGARIGYLLLAALCALPVLYHLVSSSPYRMKRLLSFLDPWSHRHDIGYQVSESLISIGSGGPIGLGIGDGRQKLFFLPAAHTDFIFSIIGEELGLLGVLFVVGCFACIVVAGFLIARRATSVFGGYLALGLTSLVGLQAGVNMAVTLGLLPTKGLTLPLVSYGGSSLIATCFALGLLLNVDATDAIDARADEGGRRGGR
ncbi:MAG: putative lipid II flippase FtsW, partial [Deltaproteobacteria bacterium]|nr:putative lipid II flippase FtsW [Deltaproteobacteria bacterium]